MNRLVSLLLVSSFLIGVNSAVCPTTGTRTFTYYIVSDLTDWTYGPDTPSGGAAAVLADSNSGWNVNPDPPALWIWDTNPVSQPSQNQQVCFVKNFYVVGTVVAATFTWNVDNTGVAFLNGNQFASNGGNWGSGPASASIPLSGFNAGVNTLSFQITNVGDLGAVSGPTVNPAGLNYKLAITVSISN